MIVHELTDGASVLEAYYQRCTCGWEALFNQTRQENKRAAAQHRADVENKRLWYAISPDDKVAPPVRTKKQALLIAGKGSARRIEPGVYEADGWIFTIEP